MSWMCFPDVVIYNSVSLWTGDATGGQDLVILVHTQWLPTQVLYRQGLTMTQHLTLSICTFVNHFTMIMSTQLQQYLY